MNIALFASAFHPSLGGVEELTRQLALELRRQGHDAIVLTNRWPRSLPREELLERIPVYRLAFRQPGVGPKSEITFRLSRAGVHRQVRQILRRHAIDVIHVQCVGSNGYYAQRASRNMDLPLVVTLQGELSMDATKLFERSKWARQTLRFALQQADAVTGCSRQTLAEAEAWYGRSFGERGSVIYNGISLGDAQAAEPYVHPWPYIFAIGRHVPQKGFDLLLRAMAELEKSGGVGHDLLLAGDGTEHAALRQLAMASGLEGRVTFVGRVDHERASQLFGGCSFFVLPSRHEPFGIVNLEAMAAGKAVLAARVGGVPEVVEDGRTGLLVHGDDVEALATGMRRLATDSGLCNRLGAAGKEKAKDFSWHTIAGQYLFQYQSVTRANQLARA